MSEHPEQAPTPAADAAAVVTPDREIEILKDRLAQAEAQAQAAKEAQLRALAELENTRRRLERDTQTSLKFANEKLIGELLGVCDSLELGIKAATNAEGAAQALLEGMQLTYR